MSTKTDIPIYFDFTLDSLYSCVTPYMAVVGIASIVSTDSRTISKHDRRMGNGECICIKYGYKAWMIVPSVPTCVTS